MKLFQTLLLTIICYSITGSDKQPSSLLVKWKHSEDFQKNYQPTEDQKNLPKQIEKIAKIKNDPYHDINYDFSYDPLPEDYTLQKLKFSLNLSQSTTSTLTHSSSENSKEK
ncbi:MAG: hypothetical protein ACXWL5_00835 [Candidatus Chromulinivorax sp.]